jgi:pimeloyl-ACP methyl ester carboxylesterase
MNHLATAADGTRIAYQTDGDGPSLLLLAGQANSHRWWEPVRGDAWDELTKIKAPTLVLHGADDLFSPAANAELLATQIPGAHAHVIPGARHAYFHEFQAVASRLVRDFLAFHS